MTGITPCVDCGTETNTAPVGETRCLPCAQERVSANQAVMEARRIANTCPKCGKGTKRQGYDTCFECSGMVKCHCGSGKYYNSKKYKSCYDCSAVARGGLFYHDGKLMKRCDLCDNIHNAEYEVCVECSGLVQCWCGEWHSPNYDQCYQCGRR